MWELENVVEKGQFAQGKRPVGADLSALIKNRQMRENWICRKGSLPPFMKGDMTSPFEKGGLRGIWFFQVVT